MGQVFINKSLYCRRNYNSIYKHGYSILAGLRRLDGHGHF